MVRPQTRKHWIRAAGVFRTVSTVGTLSTQKAVERLLASSSDINGSVLDDTVVQKNCSLHIRGNLLGNLTIESGAKVVVEGSVGGKIVNKGGRLVVNNKAHAACVTTDGPAEAEACGVLKIDLTAIVSNWEKLARYAAAECAAVVKDNAYGCGIEPIAGALAKTGCSTFFVSDIPEAKRVRSVAPNASIYVLRGLYSGTGQAFAEINARPVIYSSIEMAEWDLFVSSQRWAGGCALHVDTGESKLGLSIEEAAALAPSSRSHGITLLMSALDNPEKPANPPNERQISLFGDLRRLYHRDSGVIGHFVRHLLCSEGPFRSRASGCGALRYQSYATQRQSDVSGDRTARSHCTGSQLGSWGNYRRYLWLGRKAAHATCVGFGGIRRWLSALGTCLRR